MSLTTNETSSLSACGNTNCLLYVFSWPEIYKMFLVSTYCCNAKHTDCNDVRLKTGKTEEFNKILFQFLGSLEGKVKGLKALCDTPHEPFLVLDPLTRQYIKHYSINVTGVPAGAGLDSQEPFVFPAPGDGVDGTGGEEDEDEESTSDESILE